MLRKLIALAALAALLFTPLAGLAADAKTAITLDAGRGAFYRAGEVFSGTVAAGAAESTRVVNVLGYKQIWIEMRVKGTNAATQMRPYVIAFQARDVACWDSAGVAEYVKGYPAGDTTQNIRSLLGQADAVAAMTDTMCFNPWNPTGIAREGSGFAYADTTVLGTNDTTLAVGAITKLWTSELKIRFPPRRMNQGTTSNMLPEPATYYFPLADLNGVFFRANYLSLRFRNIGIANLNLRCRVVLFKE